MNRLITTVISLLWLALAMPCVSHAASGHPNVILAMPDDVSFNDFSFYNPSGPRTPNIDRLARQSVRLSDFHVSPTCSPTRAALLTGRYNDATGVWHTILGRNILRRDEITMADVFRANGYRTAIFGKWHLGENFPFRPQDRGFEYCAVIHGGGVGQQHDFWGNSNLKPSTYFINGDPVPLRDEDDGIPGAFSANFFTSRAIDYMKERAALGEPFFVYLPWNVAHGPQDMPPDARAGIPARRATIENLDKNMGRLLGFLETSGLADNTLLVFLTDNGGPNSFRGGKGSEYEGGHRVPCFLRWKRAGLAGDEASAREMPRLSAHIDLLPTLMDYLGFHDVTNRPASLPVHGRSLRSWLDVKSSHAPENGRNRILCVDNQRLEQLIHYKQACVMRDACDEAGNIIHKWRLIRSRANAPWLLYDVQADPHEEQNLIAQPGLSELVQQMQAAYEAWWREMSARADEYCRAVLGADAEPITCLYAHDWHTDEVPWNQPAIARGEQANGFHAVEFSQAGGYRFEVRRWPKEIANETTLSSALQTPVPHGTTGRALPIRAARLRIWNGEDAWVDQRMDVDSEADAAVFNVRALPAGPAFLQTWFYDGDGKELAGGYYIYVSRNDKTAPRD